MLFNQKFIKSVIPDSEFAGIDLPEICNFSVDSRLLSQGDIFVALKGNRVDGHDFIKDALKNGAIGLVISHDKKNILSSLDAQQLRKLCIIIFSNTQEALLILAKEWRSHFKIPVVGITGSIGKTSTKEMLANILKANGNHFIASHGNQNTALGSSLNILRMRPEHQMALFEMGISKRGEMARMAALVNPTIAVITTIGHSHMEGLGSLADIANEKRDIFKCFTENNIGIIQGDQPILAAISYKHPIIKFGYKTTNQIQARKIQSNNINTYFMLKIYKDKYKVLIDSNHTGRVNNALAASSVAYALGIANEVIVKGIQVPLHVSGRFEARKLKAAKGILIDDCYNASPESMKAALVAFEKMESKGQKIAVLADMLELGVNSAFWHRQLGRLLRKVPSLHHVILVGDMVKWTKATLPINITHEHVADYKDAIDSLKKKLDREAVILVKGSSSMKLSNLVKELTDSPATRL